MNNGKKLLEFFIGTENVDHLYILILLVILDYITGICVAIHQKRLSSKIGFKGISLKVMIFVVLSMCHVLDGYLSQNLTQREHFIYHLLRIFPNIWSFSVTVKPNRA